MSIESEPDVYYFKVKTSLLFSGKELEDWKSYEVEADYILIVAEFWGGAAGIEGELGLCVPPKKRDVEAWEGSRRAGEWDRWVFLNLITLPNPKENRWENGVLLTIFFGNNTFFDQPLRVVKSLKITAEESDGITFFTPGLQDRESIRVAVQALLPILNREFGAVVCERPETWSGRR